MQRIDGRPFAIARDERLCVLCIRNERLRLPYFLTYYRNLGITRFLVVDNDSDDGSTDLLLAEPDVYVFLTKQPVPAEPVRRRLDERDPRGACRRSLGADGRRRRAVRVPGSEERRLDQLTAALDRRGENAVMAFLLDMYSEGPIGDAVCAPGQPFLEVCPFFDRDGYEWGPPEPRCGTAPLRGGPRKRLFWSAGEVRLAPYLPKVPLVRWQPSLVYTTSTHLLENVRLSAMTGALLHFKFFSDFVERAPFEAQRAEHWEQGGEYARYSRGLHGRPDLSCMYSGSTRYKGTRQLTALGFIRVPSGMWSAAAAD